MNFASCIAVSLLWLAASHATAGPRVVSTEVLGGFSGHYAPVHPDNREPEPIAYYGTDLGFSYVHRGQLHFLFGDSWATEAYAPIEASSGARFDDAFATIDLKEWPDPTVITADHIPPLKLGQNPGTNEVAAINPGHAMDLGKTPMAGFSNGKDEFGIFNVTKPRGCASDEDCGNDLVCDTRLGYAGVPFLAEESLTMSCMDGQPGCNASTLTDEEGQVVEPSGICIDPTATVWSNTAVGRLTASAINQRVGLRDKADPRIYGDIREWLTTKFLNVTATTVESFDPASATDPSAQDYHPARGRDGKQRVFLWGRPGFIGVGAQDRSLGLYFGYVDLPRGEGYAWDVQYFTGMAGGLPRFSPSERDAVPLDLDDSLPGIQSSEAHDIVHQMSVEWVEPLGKWIMFYGGGILQIPTPVLPNCGLLEIFARSACEAVDTGNGAIRMRTADHPWGPWSPAQDVLVGGDPDVAGSGQYGPGGVLRHPYCQEQDCAPHTQTPFYNEREYGFFYAANIIAEWIRPAGAGVDVLWNASTWDPYRVVLMRTRIEP